MKYKERLRYLPIIKRLYPSFFLKIMKIFNKKKFIYKFQNILLELNLDESMDRSIFFFNYYENKQINFLKQKIFNGNYEKNCITFNGPVISEIDGKTYKFGEKCYQYKLKPDKCNSTKRIIDISDPKMANS